MPITKYFKAKKFPITACANLDYYSVKWLAPNLGHGASVSLH